MWQRTFQFFKTIEVQLLEIHSNRNLKIQKFSYVAVVLVGFWLQMQRAFSVSDKPTKKALIPAPSFKLPFLKLRYYEYRQAKPKVLIEVMVKDWDKGLANLLKKAPQRKILTYIGLSSKYLELHQRYSTYALESRTEWGQILHIKDIPNILKDNKTRIYACGRT